MDELNQLRQELLGVNQNFFNIIQQRKELVHSIQEVKLSSGKPVFCPEREWMLFNQLAGELKKLSVLELLAFSLIIEEDARSFNQAYPAWSEGKHLVNLKLHSIIELINPLLLKVTDSESFQSIQLNSDFDFIHNF